jgi:hypothetical protein
MKLNKVNKGREESKKQFRGWRGEVGGVEEEVRSRGQWLEWLGDVRLVLFFLRLSTSSPTAALNRRTLLPLWFYWWLHSLCSLH